MKQRHILILFGFIVVLLVVILFLPRSAHSPQKALQEGEIISGTFDRAKLKTEDEWRKDLTDEQFYILREKGTEVPFSGELNDEKRAGTYYSVGCDIPLFRSEQKFDSGTGWPSFAAPIGNDVLVLRKETSPGDNRIEVLDTCGNHLGHVFDDGPTTLPGGRQATGKRYCINSIALRFVPDE